MTALVRARLANATVLQARLAGWLALAVFVAVRMVRLGGPGAFPVAGGAQVHPGAPAELKIATTGYDGEFVYRLALDPFTHAVTAHGITLDMAGYRQQRIMTPLLAHLVAQLPGVGVALALLLVNVTAVAAAIWFGTALAVDLGRHPAWGLLVAVAACIPISLGRDLTEPVAWAAALAGIWLIRRRRWVWAAGALTVAVLARETTLVIIVGLVLGAAWEVARHRPGATWRAAWLLAPIVVEAAWQLRLRHVWGVLPIRSGENNTGSLPLLGPLDSLLDGVIGSHPNILAIGILYTIERVVELGLLATAAWLVVRRRTTATAGEKTAWAIAGLLALSVRHWHNDAAFLRATYEGWAMSVLVILQARRAPGRVLAAAAAVTVAVGVVYMYAA